MKTITKRELNQQTAHVLDAVAIDQPIIVTERGVARWRIEVVERSTDPVDRLRAEGRITPAKPQPAPWPAVEARFSRSEVDALFETSRGER